MRLRHLCSVICVASAVSACSSGSTAATVAVSGTATACTPAATEIEAGDVTFNFSNTSGDVSKLHVLRADGTVAAVAENVVNGASRGLGASLVAGEYTVVCTPGQKGEGFRTAITVTGNGGTPVPEADRSVLVTGSEYKFNVPDGLDVKAGESIRFVFRNEGQVDHEMELVDPNRQPIGEVASLRPKTEGEVTVTFETEGIYVMRCILKTDKVTPHDALGMSTQVVVTK